MHLNAYEAVAEAGIASMDAFIAAEDGIIDDCLSNITQTEIKLDESETYQIESLETNGTKMNVVKVGEKRIKPLLRDSISQIKDLLIRQVSSSVRWEQSIRQMIACGGDTFIEIGP